MTLFESESQYREKATLWRIFSLLPLYAPLADGRMFRWFAINIPMDLGTGAGAKFTSDIDIIACLFDFPNSDKLLYRTWEVKVSLLHKDGRTRSLKKGKLNRTKTQLRAYRAFGSPHVSLLDVYLCETEFMARNKFPPSALSDTIKSKCSELSRERFGYQLLPFEHKKDSEGDIGLSAIVDRRNPIDTTFKMLPALVSHTQQPFSQLAERLNNFFDGVPGPAYKNFNQIVFCRECRQLQLIRMKDIYECPTCQSDLIIQS
jgi:hypothetical protein